MHCNSLPLAGIATLSVLESVLPDAAREVELKTQEFIDCLLALAESADRQNILLQGLIARLEQSGDCTAALRQEVSDISAPLLAAVSGAVVSLQFQDHHAQVMAAATSMLGRYRTVLEHTHGQRTLEEADRIGNASAARIIADGITLGTLRATYLEKLGRQPAPHADIPSDIIELF